MTIAIVPLQFDHSWLLNAIRVAVDSSFGVDSTIIQARISLEAGRDHLRNQVNSSWVLSQLNRISPDEAQKVLGVMDQDLFVPVLTYLFGEAELGGRAAVVSAHRFRTENYGLPPSPALLQSRLVSEAIHELGHTFGLTHCDSIGCVMQATINVEEIDRKDRRFCTGCALFVQAQRSSANTDD